VKRFKLDIKPHSAYVQQILAENPSAYYPLGETLMNMPLFIEHYGDEVSYGSSQYDPDRYSRVEYTWDTAINPYASPKSIEYHASHPSWFSMSVEEFLKLVAAPLTAAEQLETLPESDYELIGILDRQEAVRSKELVFSRERPLPVNTFAQLEVVLNSSEAYPTVRFLWGVAHDMTPEIVKVSLCTGDERARFYAVPRAFGKAL
jgi:hypothetical protein